MTMTTTRHWLRCPSPPRWLRCRAPRGEASRPGHLSQERDPVSRTLRDASFLGSSGRVARSHLDQRAGRRRLATVLVATLVATPLALQPASAAEPRHRLTNLAHLDFLGARVAPPTQAGHTTYRLARHPRVGVLWTYADHQSDGSYQRVGGGTYDPATNTYGQGAYNADDMARAAVVYLRDWRQTGSRSAARAARGLLRGVTYLQTASGPDRGNVVLWMQPDGTLNPSADPPEQPDPSDSGDSYWLARTTWALGEGYAAFRRTDPAFARFLKHRMDLAVGALDREVLVDRGRYLHVDGRRTPAWLVADGGDASAEAVLGLVAYVRAGGTPAARRALRQLSDGIADLAGGDARSWPFGGVLPWALSRSDWHAGASQMPAALAGAARVLHDPRLAGVAARDSFTFYPWLMTSGGPDNGRLPTRVDGTQIAYGVDSRVRSLLATGGGADRIAGMVAAWFFGANASGAPVYDPATGVTLDGVAADGTVNPNSGAESTIHGLLTMLALDAHPGARRIARSAAVRQLVGTRTVEAEDAALSGGAVAVQPDSLWTGESQFSGTGYASLPDASTATFRLGAHPAALVMPVVDLRHGSTAVTTFGSGRLRLGAVHAGRVAPSGDSAAPGALLPRTLGATLPAGASRVSATTTAAGSDATRLDALLVQPLVSRLVLGGHGHGSALLRSAARSPRRTTVAVPGHGRATVWSYDGHGRLLGRHTSTASDVRVVVAPGGVTVVRR
jgi:YD repeat-containing protein